MESINWISFIDLAWIRIEKFHNLRECRTLGRKLKSQSSLVRAQRKFDALFFTTTLCLTFLFIAYCGTSSRRWFRSGYVGHTHETTKNVRSAVGLPLFIISAFEEHTRKNYENQTTAQPIWANAMKFMQPKWIKLHWAWKLYDYK